MLKRRVSRLIPATAVGRGLLVAGVVAIGAVGLAVWTLASPDASEADRLAGALALRPGMTVAEIGAGSGWLSIEIARRVGPSGQVIATELSEARLNEIRAAVREAQLANVTVVAAGEQSANLPPGCCEAIFMRRVYHHLSDAPSIVADLRRALKPGGRLAVIEFESSGLLGRATGMGIDRAALSDEIARGGFVPIRTEDWPGWYHYVSVFQPRVEGQ